MAVRAGTAMTAAGLITVVGAGIASAHVTAQPGTATKGGYSKITFRVPDESDTAGTVKLEVDLPADHPIASVSTKPIPGWTATVTKAKLDKPIKSDDAEITEAVRTITWTADPGTRIAPGQFQEFDVSAGPLPDNTDELVIPAIQTYDNGNVVRWDAPPPAPGAQEPEHPAPSVKLVAAAAAGESHGGHDSAAMTDAASHGEDTAARWLGGAGLVVGALGLGVGAGALLRARRPAAAGGDSAGDTEGGPRA
ncbi:YcnI family copper-binding membrane protein [Gandjariella thermophila]|nr:YcnI family protein [Gandjariella thermophila]